MMSKDTEKIVRELQEFMDQFKDLSEEEARGKVDEFLKQYNDKLAAVDPVEKAWRRATGLWLFFSVFLSFLSLFLYPQNLPEF